MAYEIAILNPRRKKAKGAKRAGKSRRKSSRSKSMARRNSKGQFVKKSHKRRRAKRKSHAKRRRKTVAKVLSNPRRKRRANPKRRKGKKRAYTGYVVGSIKKHPVRRRMMNPRRRRHNPRFSIAGITSQLMPAAWGAAGGVALDVALGYLPVPAQFTTGYAKHATRIVGALGIGFLGRKFLGSKGAAMGAGALTVAVYGLFKEALVQFAPSVKGLGDYEEISIDNTADQIGAYMDPAARLGAYLPDGSRAPGMGAYINGPVDDSWDRDGAVLSGMDY